MIKKNFLFTFLALAFFAQAQQEKVLDLKINPQLYNQNLQLKGEAAGKKQFTDGFFLAPRTLSLPFVDDFSKNHLKPYDLSNFQIVDTVNRSFELTTDTLVFAYMT